MDEEELEDPFSPENAPKLALVVAMRNYDALMAILTVLDKEAGAKLASLHEQGKVLGALPYLDLGE